MPSTRELRAALLLLAIALLAAGCGYRGGTPRVVAGTPCATCGMEVRDPRFAGASVAGRSIRPYDSIECALRDLASGSRPAAVPPERGARSRWLYLSDHTSGTLHRSDSLWIVRADIASPMGGGLAAFLDRAAAEQIAGAREGRVLPIDSLLPAPEAAR